LKGSSAFSQSSLFHLFFFLFIEPKFLLPFSFIFYDCLGRRRSQTADEFGGMDGDHSIKVQEEEKKTRTK
jgi:hypothetical protein